MFKQEDSRPRTVASSIDEDIVDGPVLNGGSESVQKLESLWLE